MIVCDPISDGMEHVPINFNFLNSLLLLNPDEEIDVFFEKSHWECLKGQLDKHKLSQIKYNEILSWKRRTNKIDWFRQLSMLLNIKKTTDINEKLFFFGVNRPIYLWLSLFFNGKNTTVVFHSILADIDGWQPRNPFYSVLTLKTIMKVFNRKAPKLIVLESYIKENLIKIIPSLRDKVFVISHPLPIDNALYKNKFTEIDVFNIGFPGVFSNDKGAHEFYQLASLFQLESVRFHVIGRNPISEERNKFTDVFSSGPYDKPLARNKFIDELCKCQFLFLCQNTGHYQLTASGVILDAIYFEVPIIAKKTPNLKVLTGNRWDIGYFYETAEQLNVIIEKLDSKSDHLVDEYNGFIAEIRKLKELRHLEYQVQIREYLAKL
mgnify:CR=1 FL=1